MSKILIIVESPPKARTISRFLGKDYLVESSIGHVRDLPSKASEIPSRYKKKDWARIGVDTENGFKPLYIVPSGKKEQIKRLKQLVQMVSELYLATDEDREGEAIAWHLTELLKPKIPVRRMVFHEMTEQAIIQALKNPRQIDQRRVEAQEARRILDRLYGYEVSPLLWIKIKPKLSAGRVQSVANRLIVNRERERISFRSAGFSSLRAVLQVDNDQSMKIDSVLVRLENRRIAVSKDFDASTGSLRKDAVSEKVLHLNPKSTEQLKEQLLTEPFVVDSVRQTPFTQKPSAPFITSTLQQEAGGKLRFTASRTMRVAQRLYENGYITYMRTDSVILSEQAVQAARHQINELFGQPYLPTQHREYKQKVKGAQEAHEAIRPTGSVFHTPKQLQSELDEDAIRLYELIWKRTLASQMENAIGQRTRVLFETEVKSAIHDQSEKPAMGKAIFSATGRVMVFDGFLRVYENDGPASKKSASAEGESANSKDKDRLLPPLDVGDILSTNQLVATEHHTKPPARYTESSLVKVLEERGIGRPSTYANIIQTIQDRGYAWKKSGALVPTLTAFAVNQLLEKHFSRLVDYEFTAQMESDLDQISSGKQSAQPWLYRFYFGQNLKVEEHDKVHLNIEQLGLKEKLSVSAEHIDARAISTFDIGELDGESLVARVGRFGPYIQVGETDRRAYITNEIILDELSPSVAKDLISEAERVNRELGTHSETGETIFLKSGRYGPYVQLGEIDLEAKGRKKQKPKMASLWPNMLPEDLNLEQAELLLSFPRILGAYPNLNTDITIQDGPYGPYVSYQKEDGKSESRSLEKHEQLLTCTLEHALELFSKPAIKKRRSAQGPLAQLGISPLTKKEIEVRTGRFGPYVTDGQINASIPTAKDPMKISFDDALELIAAREERIRADGKEPRPINNATSKSVNKTTDK